MPSKKVGVCILVSAILLGAAMVYKLIDKSSEFVSYEAVLTNKEDVAREVYSLLGNNDVEIVEERLVLREQYLKVTGGRLDMSDLQQAATADDLIWGVWTKGPSLSSLPMLDEEQTAAILGFDAATGDFIGVYGGTAESMAPFTAAFTEIPDLYGTIKLVAKEVALLPDTAPPPMTPVRP